MQTAPVLALFGHAVVNPPRRLRPINAVPARLGFPSPAEDFEDGGLDLNKYIIRNEAATFFYRSRGRSQEAEGIYDGDVIAVDRSLTPEDGDLVVAQWDGNTAVCKTLRVRASGIELHSADPSIPPICVPPAAVFEAFVVTGVIRRVNRGARRVRAS